MGSYRHVYIGPYVKCIVEKVKETIKVRACPNAGCTKPKPKSGWDKVQAQFCDVCGTAVAEVDVTVERYPSIYDVLGDDESLTPLESGSPEEEGVIYLGSNYRSQRRYNIDDEEYHLDVHMVDTMGEVKRFEEECATALDALRYYFKKPIHISWGVHLYRR